VFGLKVWGNAVEWVGGIELTLANATLNDHSSVWLICYECIDWLNHPLISRRVF